MVELSSYYLEQKDVEIQKAVIKESNELELECQLAIEKAQVLLISGFFREVSNSDNVEIANAIGSNVSKVQTLLKDRHQAQQKTNQHIMKQIQGFVRNSLISLTDSQSHLSSTRMTAGSWNSVLN